MKLSTDQQQAIRNAVQASEEYLRKIQIANDKRLLKTLKEKGMIINEIENKQPFVAATKVVYDQFSDVFPPALIKRIRETKTKKYSYTYCTELA